MGWQSRRRDNRRLAEDKDGLHNPRSDRSLWTGDSVELPVSVTPFLVVKSAKVFFACIREADSVISLVHPYRIMMWAWKVGPALAA